MTKPIELLDPIRLRIDAATKGPWRYEYVKPSKYDSGNYWMVIIGGYKDEASIELEENADFIANVRTDADRMERALRYMLEVEKVRCVCEKLGERCGYCELRDAVAAILEDK